ncbi:putative serine/threonine-protein kinase WNK7 [Capsicum baccatum]|uniref:non-specific serine/threonine protein kinase n=1 Tax=Capsicum baccatum TaxID=33114 RepID=A0A2G2VX05_CAPBA|nr:putative serine/threonine-protein kinase WNK7 [Capsicum baccatum]
MCIDSDVNIDPDGIVLFSFSYKAFDLHDGIESAWSRVKVEDVFQSPDKLGKLYAEMHLLRKLKHGNIIKFCDSWVDDKKRTVNMITELFTSGKLRYHKKYRSVDAKAIKNWASSMCMLELVTFEDPYSECKNPTQIFKKVSSGVKPSSLSKVTDPQIKAFIEKCLVPASLRLPATDLLKDPFLQIENLNEPTYSLFLDFTLPKSKIIKFTEICTSFNGCRLRRFHQNNEFKLTGKKKYENSVSLTLQIKSHSAEMVEHLELADHDVDFIADFIDYRIVKILPSWKPSDYFSSGGRSQREEAIENYLTLSPITTTSNAWQDDIPVLNMNNQIDSTHRADEDKLNTNSRSTSFHITFASPSHLKNV